MERLTDSDKEIPTLIDNAEYWLKVYFKLKEYEDLEEQDRLIKLPCKVGDTVYKADMAHNKVFQHKVMRILKVEQVYFENYDYCFLHHFGKTVFLTKAEAEARLKELRCNND